MSSTQAKPRRTRVPGEDNRNVYQRADGRYEIGYRDSTGKQRWKTVPGTGGITAAREERNRILGRKANSEHVEPTPRLKFGEAADRLLGGPVASLRQGTQDSYRNSIEVHLRPRWGRLRMDHIRPEHVSKLVTEMRVAGRASGPSTPCFVRRRGSSPSRSVAAAGTGATPFPCWRTASGPSPRRRSADACSRRMSWPRRSLPPISPSGCCSYSKRTSAACGSLRSRLAHVSVTRTVYLQEVKSAERTARRRAKMEARCGSMLGSLMEAEDGSTPEQAKVSEGGNVRQLRG
jgi:hypothetical protein